MNMKIRFGIDPSKETKRLSRNEFSQDGYRATKTQVVRNVKKYTRKTKHKAKWS